MRKDSYCKLLQRKQEQEVNYYRKNRNITEKIKNCLPLISLQRVYVTINTQISFPSCPQITPKITFLNTKFVPAQYYTWFSIVVPFS